MNKYANWLLLTPATGLLIVFGFIVAMLFGYEVTITQTTALFLLFMVSVLTLSTLWLYFSLRDWY